MATAVLTSGNAQKAAGATQRMPFDLGNVPQIISGVSVNSDGTLTNSVSIVSYTITASPTGLTISSSQLDYFYQASAKIAGGTAGTSYTVTIAAVLDDPDGTVISRSGVLQVL